MSLKNSLTQTILWRRLDAPGYDACALFALIEGWRLAGTAVFALDEIPCHLSYEVLCDGLWRTRSATVRGWIGRHAVELLIDTPSPRRWSFNGSVQDDLEGLTDVDLGFTPATNLIQLRRLDLEIGEGVDAPVVYLEFPELALGRLDHRYDRRTQSTYDYAAPRFDYAATLEVSDVGFVTRYPGLWDLEALR